MQRLRMTLLGIGAMNSPRFGPAGLLVRYGRERIASAGEWGIEGHTYQLSPPS
jgi:hypothetical protein